MLRGEQATTEQGTAGAGAESTATSPRWPTEARPPGWLEGSLGVGLIGASVALPFLFPPDTARWTGGVLFDGAIRRGLHLSRAQRVRVTHSSDGMLYATAAFPLLDVGGLMLARRVDPQLGLRILLVELQSFGVAGFATAVAKVSAARERPYGVRCASDPGELDCESSQRFLSFFSGHTSLTFTAAGLTCVMHEELRLYRRRAVDHAACGLALAAATTTGVLRVVAEKHWTSDVLVGAGVGLLSGWLLPYLVYFRSHTTLPRTGLAHGVLSPWIRRGQGGLRYDAFF